ncbi:AAA family ATPase [Arenibacter aquaticus]|uniref:AAA family ATPase n=1 Tax=Arenibacter aquaticus TaxID=2489054 RepID=UPI00192E490E|nr:ATP-binding protein [Arenibacter aquaticus]
MDYVGIIQWLLKGDVSIQYQVYRDLLGIENKGLQQRIVHEGWGAQFLAKRNADGHWGQGFYRPKWTSTHYTLLDLRNLGIATNTKSIQETIAKVLRECKAADGGIYPISKKSDVCVNGMFLNYASYFKANGSKLDSVIDALLNEWMGDGGFNCRSNRSGAVHSSLHSTLSVLEGMTEYVRNGYTYRLDEVKKSIASAKEFVLTHQLFISDRSGEIIDLNFCRFSYPRRWHYDVLSALDFFQYSRSEWDPRMQPAIKLLLQKRKKDGRWNLQAKHPGQTHFEMERAREPSRWNTLRALRILKYYKLDNKANIVMVMGLPGSGKSYFAERLAKSLGADYCSSDQLRKLMFAKRTYSTFEKERVYKAMRTRMQESITQRKDLVLDATFHKKETRDEFRNLAAGAKLFFIQVWADEMVTRERLKKTRPFSEADIRVYLLIKEQWEDVLHPCLLLQSTNHNIDSMLEGAINYIKDDKGTDF